VEQVESQFPNQLFWLDPHRIVVHALKELGPSYHLAKESVVDEIKTLVRRLPQLPACRFSDEVPFADEETRRWLDELQHSHVEAPASEGRDNGTFIEDGKRIAELRMQASTLLEQGRVREAVALLQKESSSVGSERDRFLLTIEAAKLCLRGGHPNIALSQLEGLDERITRFSLDQWEPRLCLDVWRTMWQLLQQLGRDSKRPVPEWTSRCEVLYRRICGVDVLSAWDLEAKRPLARSRS
jgi:type VI secretion system protein VasJ